MKSDTTRASEASTLAKFAKHERLTPEATEALGVRAIAGDKRAAQKLATCNMKLAIKLAHSYAKQIGAMDAVQEAAAGLALAAGRWDPALGVPFGAFAAMWIRASLRSAAMKARTVHTGNTRAGRKVYNNLGKARAMLASAGEAHTVENLARVIGVSVDDVTDAMVRLDGCDVGIDAPVASTEDGDATLADVLADESCEAADCALAAHEARALTLASMARYAETLDGRDRAIWEDAIVTGDSTYLEIGQRIGVSKQRIGQLAKKIVADFRAHVQSDGTMADVLA